MGSWFSFRMLPASCLTFQNTPDDQYFVCCGDAVFPYSPRAGNGGNGYAALLIAENSILTNLYCAGTIVDADGNAVTIIGTDGTVYVQGTREFTITVDSYDNTVDTSAASAVDSWSDFAVAKP